MAYKDKDKQREAVRQAVQRHRQGITQEPNNVIPDVIPKTVAGVKALTAKAVRTIVDKWAAGEGTEYQRRMGVLAQCYRTA